MKRVKAQLWRWRMYLTRTYRNIKSLVSHESVRLILLLLLLAWEIVALALLNIGLPHALLLRNSEAVIEIFSVTIGALSAILGIVIAFLIATFEMNKKYLGARYVENLFKNENLRGLVVLYVGTILIAVSGLLVMGYGDDRLITNMIIVTVFLFAICITVLIPRMRMLVSETSMSREIKKLVAEFVSGIRVGVFSMGRRSLGSLIEIGKKASAAGEESVVVEMFDLLNEKFTEKSKLLDSNDTARIGNATPRDMATAFSAIFYVIGSAAVNNRQFGIAEYAGESILRIMNTYAENKQRWHNLVETEKYFEKYLKHVISSSTGELSDRLIWKYQDFIVHQLKVNSPPAEELYDFDAFDENKRTDNTIDYDLQNHWDHISGYDSKFRDLITFSIERDNRKAMQRLLHSLHDLAGDIVRLAELTDDHKRHALRSMYWNVSNSYSSAIHHGKITRDDSFTLFALDPHYAIDEYVVRGANYAVWDIQTVCNVYLFATAQGVLPTHALNNIGTAGRSLKRHVKESDLARKTVIYVAAMLGKIKDVVADDVGDDVWAADIYMACYHQTKSIQKWEIKVKNQSVTRKLNALLKEYKHVDSAQTTVKGDRVDVWEDLFGDDGVS